MGLEHLKSIFTEGLEIPDKSDVQDIWKKSDFESSQGGLFNNKSVPYSTAFNTINTPKFEDIINSGNITTGGGYPNKQNILETFLGAQGIAPPTYIQNGIINTERTLVKDEIPKFNDLFTVDNGKVVIGAQNRDKTWESLYNADHTPKADVGYHYLNVSRDNLNIRYNQNPSIRSMEQKEPYIVSNIGSDKHKNSSRELSINRAKTDEDRIIAYLNSEHGKQFKKNQRDLGLRSNVEMKIGIMGVDAILSIPQPYSTLYNSFSTIQSVKQGMYGPSPKVLFAKDDPVGLRYPLKINISHKSGLNLSIPFPGQFKIEDTFRGGGVVGGNIPFTNIGGKVRSSNSGDKMTLASMIQGVKLGGIGKTIAVDDLGFPMDIPFDSVDIESEKNGMPFYFKDLRDDTYIFFRAYIEGMTENIAPSWASENYIGRSEPVYIYERAERDISFTLKLFAHSPKELDAIYKKLDRLISLCYPQYAEDPNMNNKLRMKPPLTKFRLGELFGSKNNEMLGFIKSISNSYPDSSPWETKQGKRVPKHIMTSLSFQVIHAQVPSLDHIFYGYDSKNILAKLAGKLLGGAAKGLGTVNKFL